MNFYSSTKKYKEQGSSHVRGMKFYVVKDGVVLAGHNERPAAERLAKKLEAKVVLKKEYRE